MSCPLETFYFNQKPETLEEAEKQSRLFAHYSNVRQRLVHQRRKIGMVSKINENLQDIVVMHDKVVTRLTNRNRTLECTNQQLKVELDEGLIHAQKMGTQARELKETIKKLTKDCATKDAEIENLKARLQKCEDNNVKLTQDAITSENHVKYSNNALQDKSVTAESNYDTKTELSDAFQQEPIASTSRAIFNEVSFIEDNTLFESAWLETIDLSETSNDSQKSTKQRGEENTMRGHLRNLNWSTADADILCVIFKTKKKEPISNATSTPLSKLWKKITAKKERKSSLANFTNHLEIATNDLVFKFVDPNFGGRKSEIIKEIAKVNDDLIPSARRNLYGMHNGSRDKTL